jgi:hypothetical protein
MFDGRSVHGTQASYDQPHCLSEAEVPGHQAAMYERLERYTKVSMITIQ